MTSIFQKWRNKEISDIECIRELHTIVIKLHKKNTDLEKKNEELKDKLEDKKNVL